VFNDQVVIKNLKMGRDGSYFKQILREFPSKI